MRNQREQNYISSPEKSQSQKEQELYYQAESSNRQKIFYCSEDEKEVKLNTKLSTTHSLTIKDQSIDKEFVANLKGQPSKSIFHNFSKHLVITLRKFIKIQKSVHKEQLQYLGFELWANFVKQSKIYTKNILQFVFGVVDSESPNLTNIYDEDIIKKFGYSKIFLTHSDCMIRQAQQLLRREVVKQLKDADLNSVLRIRRMKNADQFQQYIKEFISQLEQGPIRKRLPKIKKEEMSFKKRQTIEETNK